MTRKLKFVFCFSFALPLIAQVKIGVKPAKLTLCEIIRNPSEYNDKEVTIRAQYATDHIERSFLFDESCRGSGVLPYLQDNAIGADIFNDAISVREPPHLKQSIVATFTGRFHLSQKPEMCMLANQEICRRSFKIEKVEDLILTMTADEKPGDTHQ